MLCNPSQSVCGGMRKEFCALLRCSSCTASHRAALSCVRSTPLLAEMEKSAAGKSDYTARNAQAVCATGDSSRSFGGLSLSKATRPCRIYIQQSIEYSHREVRRRSIVFYGARITLYVDKEASPAAFFGVQESGGCAACGWC